MEYTRSSARTAFLVVCWAFYDLANQFFALNVVSLYFTRWLTFQKGASEWYYSAAFGVSTLMVALLSPLLGAMSDYTSRRKPFLIWFTLTSTLFTAAIGAAPSLFAGLFFFMVAHFSCQMAVVFYNSLLVGIVDRKKAGLVSGIGMVFSYSGAIVALYTIKPVVLRFGYQATFIPTGILFLLFALPCLVFVRDRAGADIEAHHWRRFFTVEALKGVLDALRRTVFMSRGREPLPVILRAAFCTLSAVNAVILFMSVYATRVFHLNESEIINLIAFSTVFAIVGSFVSGWASDRVRLSRLLSAVFLFWVVSFVLGSTLSDKRWYYVVGSLVGVALGSTWVVLRAYIIKETPDALVGKAFGMYSLIGYMSAISGAIFWGIALLVLKPLGETGYRITLFLLSGFPLAGLYFLKKLPHER
jgi:MFS transporter, UMF1 family